MSNKSSGSSAQSRVRRVVAPIQEFIQTEVFSGGVLLLAAIAAIAWANSPFDDAYFDLFSERMVVDTPFFTIDENIQHWVIH